INIGNAKLLHMESDVGLVGSEFNCGYVIFEIPSNLILYKVRPSIWLPTIMIAWGITASFMAFVKSYTELLFTRALLGVFEAGLLPGIVYYFTIWYKRYEQGFRIGIIMSSISIGGAFSGLLAYTIANLTDDDSPLKGWQLVYFIIDGLGSIIVAIIAYFNITDYPEEVKWLNEEERSLAVLRLKLDDAPALSDRTNLRGPFLMLFASIGVVEYIIILYSENMKVKYIATCIISIGIAPCSAIAIIWLSNNLSPPLKCNIGVAMMISCGNCGGIIATQIYHSVDYPNYVLGHTIASSTLLAAACLSAIQYVMLGRLNELKRRKKISIKASIEEDEKELGDRHYNFKYTL
ncbi:17798_t:CDS:2, partial [Racocetra persica]